MVFVKKDGGDVGIRMFVVFKDQSHKESKCLDNLRNSIADGHIAKSPEAAPSEELRKLERLRELERWRELEPERMRERARCSEASALLYARRKGEREGERKGVAKERIKWKGKIDEIKKRSVDEGAKKERLKLKGEIAELEKRISEYEASADKNIPNNTKK
jgi:hypothetical protein